MSQFLKKVEDVDPNNSEAVKDALSGFFQNIRKYSDANPHQWLRTLEDIIKRFPKYCMTHRNTIEVHLAQFLDSSNFYLVIEAAKCSHVLQQVRPSQEKTATPKTCWREQTSLLCNSAHSLIGAIFPKAVDVYKNTDQHEDQSTSSTSPLSLALSQITEISKTSERTKNYDVQDRHNLLCIRLKNVLVFLQAMLVEPYPVAKPVRPQLILDALVRALTAAGSGAAGLTSADDVAAVKIEALRAVDALVICLGSNLIPFSPLVFRMVMQTLRWCSDNPTKESRKVRIQAYKTLTSWLTTLRCHKPEGGRRDAKGRGLEEELVAAVLDDVTPQRHVVQLKMSSQPTKNLSKKAKRKMANTMLQESALATHMPGEKNKITGSDTSDEELIVAALECLEMFLTVCGIFLKPTTHKLVQERLLIQCYSSGGSAPLIRALAAARRGAGAKTFTPTQRCMSLYATLANCNDPDISKLCTQALQELKMQLQCAPPTISYALEYPKETENKSQEKKMGISERNRAALEALLGADRVPSNLTEEIITITDEPLPKKVRLSQDVEENISVSSDSSVELCEDEHYVQVQDEVKEIEQNNEDEPDAVIEVDDENIEVENENGAEKIKNAPNRNIHELVTQIDANVSNDTTDGIKSPNSLEVEYDYPNTRKSQIPVLEKMEEDNLPSTNETDDIQITCGQVIKSSQEASQKRIEDAEVLLQVNGFKELNGKVCENGLSDSENVAEKVTETVTVKIAATDGVTVEDMLADFVDEVNDEGLEV